MKPSENWGDFSIAEMIVGVVTENEEITLKELSNRLRSVNSGHRIYSNAINKAISLFLTEVFIPIRKDTWRINRKNDDRNEEKIALKKARKMRKHFEVLINGRKAKILNFRFKPYEDEYESGEVLELVSKVNPPLSPGGAATFEMEKDNKKFWVKGQFKSASISPGNYIWTFIVLERTERPTAEPTLKP